MLMAWLGLSGLDWAVVAVASYLALMPLVRLMRARRDAILDELQDQIEREKTRQKEKKRREEQRQLREEIRRKRSRAA